MAKYNKESLKAEKTRINHLLDLENRNCAKCKDKAASGCEGCYHGKRKKHLGQMKEKFAQSMANAQG